MINRATGWLLSSQVVYLALFLALTAIDQMSGRAIFYALQGLRSFAGLEHRLTGVSDYLYYPFLITAPLNVLFLLLFLRRCHIRSGSLSFQTDVFSLLNAAYILGSGWVLFGVYASLLKA